MDLGAAVCVSGLVFAPGYADTYTAASRTATCASQSLLPTRLTDALVAALTRWEATGGTEERMRIGAMERLEEGEWRGEGLGE